MTVHTIKIISETVTLILSSSLNHLCCNQMPLQFPFHKHLQEKRRENMGEYSWKNKQVRKRMWKNQGSFIISEQIIVLLLCTDIFCICVCFCWEWHFLLFSQSSSLFHFYWSFVMKDLSEMGLRASVTSSTIFILMFLTWIWILSFWSYWSFPQQFDIGTYFFSNTDQASSSLILKKAPEV